MITTWPATDDYRAYIMRVRELLRTQSLTDLVAEWRGLERVFTLDKQRSYRYEKPTT